MDRKDDQSGGSGFGGTSRRGAGEGQRGGAGRGGGQGRGVVGGGDRLVGGEGGGFPGLTGGAGAPGSYDSRGTQTTTWDQESLSSGHPEEVERVWGHQSFGLSTFRGSGGGAGGYGSASGAHGNTSMVTSRDGSTVNSNTSTSTEAQGSGSGSRSESRRPSWEEAFVEALRKPP